MTSEKPRRLGRGLEALLQSSAAAHAVAAGDQGSLRRVPVAEIRPNPFQPRKDFRPEELSELESSLRESGLLQPIALRASPAPGGGYELIAGERRLRAAIRLGWADIPAVVREVDDRTLLTLALVENLQRSDLNPLEEAEGYQRLMSDFGLTQQQVAESLGKDRSTVANVVRLLSLPASVRRFIQEGRLSLGHAKAILALGSEQAMTELARDVVEKGLSVRETENRAREGSPYRQTRARKAPLTPNVPAEASRIEGQLRRYLQTDVRLTLDSKDRGTLRIPFYSADDLERILDLILGPDREVS